MIVLDFLFFYLTHYFESNRSKLKWSTPLERAVYVVTIATMFWIFTAWESVEIFITKTDFLKNLNMILGIIIGLCVMQIYKYVYLTKKRYAVINSPERQTFAKINKKTGQVIALAFVMFSTILPFFIMIVFS